MSAAGQHALSRLCEADSVPAVSFFSVLPESLLAGSALLPGGQPAGLGGHAVAASLTPADAAWEELVAQSEACRLQASASVGELRQVLAAAGRVYATTDRSVAAGERGGG